MRAEGWAGRGRDLESDIQRDTERGTEGDRFGSAESYRDRDRDRKCNREIEKGGWGDRGQGETKRQTEEGGQVGQTA